MRYRSAGSILLAALLLPASCAAWDVACEDESGEKCPDTFSIARTPWRAHPRSEHRELLDLTILYSGLPGVLRDPFTLRVFARATTVSTDDDVEYASVSPVVDDAERLHEREISIPAMANLPDFSYALWDLASGNEFCPPDPSGPVDAFECHNYETHIGWLNSNHMLPQARRWYEHLHAIALTLAAGCKAQATAVPPALRARYEPYLFGCEKQALMVEAVGHHYLQDSWSVGHLWERWGGTQESDFNGDQALGFAVAALTGLIHGGKAIFDEKPVFKLFRPWDDPMCAPHENVDFIDVGAGDDDPKPGVGDIFLPELMGAGAAAQGDRFADQRRSLFGCGVNGIRAVYAETARLHGPMGAAQASQIDGTRSVANDSCWAQRATNAAIAEGFGVHHGEAPNAKRFIPDETQDTGGLLFADALQPLLLAQLTAAPLIAGAPVILNPITLARFKLDASYAASLAIMTNLIPENRNLTNLASGGLPAIAGIQPNRAYARGNPAAGIPPAFWADPFPPWSLEDDESANAPRKEVLNLFFADANAAQRCRDFHTFELEDYVDAVDEVIGGVDALLIEARCGQCIQMIAPHLRHGQPGNFDARREAFCALVAPNESAFLYTGENPASFTNTEPLTFEALEKAASVRCHCTETTTTTTTTTTTLPPPEGTVRINCSGSGLGLGASASTEAQLADTQEDYCSDSPTTLVKLPTVGESRSCDSEADNGTQTSNADSSSSLNLSLANPVETFPGTSQYFTTGITISGSSSGTVLTTPASPSAFSGAYANGIATCEFTVENAPVQLIATAGGGYSGKGRVDIYIRSKNGFPIGGYYRREGVSDQGGFPLNITLNPQQYVLSMGVATQVTGTNGSGSSNGSLSLAFTDPP